MSTLAEAQVDHRIYRNWFRLNQRCTISVVTGAGLTDEGEAGETLAQGSGGAALVSQLKVDRGIDDYFRGSGDEECYGAVRLQPLSWQDDVVGLGGEIRLVQAGLNRLNYFVEESQLEVHPDPSKSSYVVFGSKSYQQEVQRETLEDPLQVGEVKLERTESMTYLGEVLHQDGLAASVDSTVEVRAARVRGAVFEIKSLCEDFRMQICGGMVGAVQLFESGIVPKLLANAGTWVGITATTIKKLDAIQNLFVQVVLRLPSSTVLPSYRAETAMVGFKWRVYLEKLRLMEAIKRQEDEVLAKEVLEQQLLMGWPGLAREVEEICREVGLPNLCYEEVDKKTMEEAVFYNHYKSLKEEMKKYRKLDSISDGDFTEMQGYMKHYNLEFSRMAFRLRTRQFRCRANMPKLYGDILWCHSCSTGPEDGPGGGPAPVESQGHLEVRAAYSHLRVGRDVELCLEDRVRYFMELIVEREKQKWT